MVDLSQLQPILSDEDLELEAAKLEAMEYLRSTNQYIIRNFETGAPIPDGVREKRKQAYSLIDM